MKLPPGYVAGLGVHKATAYGGLGQRLMERMGWSKGQGLGKEKHGMKDAIEVKKKEDTLGVGANGAWNWEQKYWEDAYNSAIQNINHSLTVNRDGTLATASEAELRIAAELAKDPWGRWGGRAGKMARIRAQEQEEANRARAKLGLPPLPVATALPPAFDGDDSSNSSSSGEDTDSDGPSTRGRRGRGVSQGKDKGAGERQTKRDKAANGKVKKMKKKAKEKKEPTDAGGSGEEGVNDMPDSAAPAKPAPKRVVVVVGSEAAVAARLKMFASFRPTPATGWWGAKMFSSAGLLESLEDETAGDQRLTEAAERQAADEAAGRVSLGGTAAVAAGQRRGFNEDDQAALYKRVHDFQRVGRRGLGKGEVKVGGTKWAGTKKTFGEEGDDGEDGDDEEEGGGGRGGKDEEEEEEEQRQVRKQGTANEAGNSGREKDVEEEEEGEERRRRKREKKKKKEKKGQEEDTAEAAGPAEGSAAATEKGAVKAGEKKTKKKKERRHQGEQEQAEKVVSEGQQVQETAEQDGTTASRKAKKRKVGNMDAGATTAVPVLELPQPRRQQQEDKEKAAQESLAAGGAAATAASTPTTADAPKPKWLKLARMVLKKSAERRVKLRKVIAELVLHAEEQHRNHHQHNHHNHHHSGREHGHEGKEGNSGKKNKTKKDKKGEQGAKSFLSATVEDSTAKDAGGASSGNSNTSPWDHDVVRQALERKIRKSNSGLAIDGKFLTMEPLYSVAIIFHNSK
ncbi:hypothetical protein VOLCADRAFT_120649 [Volvox carteri f. nagariensis]|uniref:G-patch domain-containing protein n=1 Tax=Volvox carteri f. nagariensis TaxID=3068 RepID=D8TQ94_VOLCA|nr:uncharacterized protein VOLCADRAFT_120649 [Volvox carteri f. nagariensis]EFJ50365.1 hypothetical protein VOLCADRAFT_120649 [Volvox carteri f. nagariensis]|eukprot:XP_002948490.1 hypothetical protein VOLCADRAFT_120649 [Volvox carteri f. nagariensis]